MRRIRVKETEGRKVGRAEVRETQRRKKKKNPNGEGKVQSEGGKGEYSRRARMEQKKQETSAKQIGEE